MDDKFLLLKKKFDALTRKPGATGETQSVGTKTGKQTGPLVFTLPPEWIKLDPFVYTRSYTVDHTLDSCLFTHSLLNPGNFTLEDITFFDLETTGLSGGAGNIFFLIALARITGASLCIEQFFLADFPGENNFLNLLKPRLAPERLYVSYNGKGFDSHVLSSRYLLHGMEISLPHQLDILYPARRMWKNTIGSCSLGDMEQKILNIARTEDIPGYLVPDVYFTFLKTGDTRELLKVFTHNYQDICSLALLLQKLLLIFAGKEKHPLVDYHKLGEFLLEHGEASGIALLEQSLQEGNPLSGKTLSLYYKKLQEWQKAVDVWQAMDIAHRSLFASIELAKYYEHKEQEYTLALYYVERVWDSGLPLERKVKEDLKKRKKRIREKMQNRKQGKPETERQAVYSD